jgi:hypothetical protein
MNKISTMLSSNTKIGLTPGQLLAAFIVVATIVGYGYSIQLRQSTIEFNYLNLNKEIVQMKQDQKDNRNERVTQINELSDKNDAQHKTLSEGQERIYLLLLGRSPR